MSAVAIVVLFLFILLIIGLVFFVLYLTKKDCKTKEVKGVCSKTCGGGTRTITTKIITEPSLFGTKCPDELEKTEDCNTQKCYSVETRKTPENDWGQGHTVFLDRHDVSCEDKGVLKSLKLIHPKEDQINYEFSCIGLPDMEGTEVKQKGTQPTEDGGGNVIYLDRHDLNCDENGTALSQFRYNNNITYGYRCKKVPSMTTCRDVNTEWKEHDTKNISLINHNIKCGDDEALTRMKLETKDNKIRYIYKCCKI